MSRIFAVLAIVVLAVFSASPSLLFKLMYHTDELVSGVRSAFVGYSKLTDTLPTELRIVGDIMLARHVETLMMENGANYPYSRIDRIQNAVWLGNFEAAVPDSHKKTEDFTFKFSVDKQYVDTLKQFGFTHLSLANNHSYDFGESGFVETQKNLHDFVAFGRPGTVDGSSISYIYLKDHTVGVLALEAVTHYPEIPQIKALIQEMNETSDSQLVYIHWGDEYALKHNEQQETFAKQLINLGVDAIAGHHPHVVQDVAMIDDGVVFYSLGNFIFDQYFDQNVQEGLTLALSIKDNQLAFDLHPVTSHDVKAAPRYMIPSEKERFLQTLASRADPAIADELKKGSIYIDF